MFKVYKQLLEEFYVLLAYMKTQGLSIKGARASLSARYTNLPGKHQNMAYTILRSPQLDEYRDPDHIFEELHDILASPSRSQDGDLIDLMVKILQLPHVRNIISGDTLAALRRGLLLPNEMGGLIERLRKRSMSCMNCAHEFGHYEALVMLPAIEGRNESALYCLACYKPALVMCKSCGKGAVLSEKVRNSLYSFNCVECDAKEGKVDSSSKSKKAQKVEAARVRMAQEPDQERMMEELRRLEREAIRPAPTAPPRPPAAVSPFDNLRFTGGTTNGRFIISEDGLAATLAREGGQNGPESSPNDPISLGGDSLGGREAGGGTNETPRNGG